MCLFNSETSLFLKLKCFFNWYLYLIIYVAEKIDKESARREK